MTEEKKVVEKLPKTKKIYSFDYNGKYMGESKADLDQKTKNSYIYPSFSTDLKPPKAKKDFDTVFIKGKWEQKKIVIVVEDEEVIEKTWEQKRVLAYPSIYDYVDGIVKNDTAQIQKYIDDCLAVKLLHPKPVEGE